MSSAIRLIIKNEHRCQSSAHSGRDSHPQDFSADVSVFRAHLPSAHGCATSPWNVKIGFRWIHRKRVSRAEGSVHIDTARYMLAMPLLDMTYGYGTVKTVAVP